MNVALARSDAAPAERPPLPQMGAATRELHDSRRRERAVPASRAPHDPARPRATRATSSRGRRRRPRSSSRGDGAWSELPHLYARYGTPGTTRADRARCASSSTRRAASSPTAACRRSRSSPTCSIGHGAHAIAMRQVYNKTRAFFECDRQARRRDAHARRRRRSRRARGRAAPRDPARVRRDVHEPARPRAGHPGARRARAPRAGRAARDRLDDRDAVGHPHAAARSGRRRRHRQPDEGARRPGRRARRLHRDERRRARQPDHGSDRDARRHPRRRARPPRRRAPRRRPSACTRAAARPPRRSPRSSRATRGSSACSTRRGPIIPMRR